jgi:hypothetical protein
LFLYLSAQLAHLQLLTPDLLFEREILLTGFIMAFANYISELLEQDILTETQHGNIIALHKQEIKRSALQQSTSVATPDHLHLAVPGNITIDATLSRSTLVAVSEVFNTPELLEHIIAFSDPRHILCNCSVVCRGFRQMIKTLPRLRSRLFLAPAPSSWAFPPASFLHDFSGPKGIRNLILAYDDDELEKNHIDNRERVLQIDCETFLQSLLDAMRAGLHIPSQNLMFQPPMQTLHVTCVARLGRDFTLFEDPPEDIRAELVLHNEAGITLGDVMIWVTRFSPPDEEEDDWPGIKCVRFAIRRPYPRHCMGYQVRCGKRIPHGDCEECAALVAKAEKDCGKKMAEMEG